MAPTLATSCAALPPEGAGLAWGGPALAATAPTLATSCAALPPEGAGLAWGGPALAATAPTLATSCAALSPEGAGLAWGGPARVAGAPALADACAFWLSCAKGSLATGTASPVSRDSSTSSWPSISSASAAMRSPSCSTSRSPRTTSRPAMRCSWPSRITSARGADRSRRDSSARWVLRSCASVMPMTTNTKPSKNSASPRSPSAR